MFEQTPILTNVGETMLVRSLAGERICFTRFKAGSGMADGTDPAQLLDLRQTQVVFPITSMLTGGGNEYMTVSGRFDNEMLEGHDLYWREVGLFCAMERTTDFTQQGSEKTYTLSSRPYDVISVKVGTDTISSDNYDYNRNTGVLTLNQAPMVGKTITVTHPDAQDYLYAYCYDAQNTGLILSATSSTRLTQTVEMVITIKGAEIDVLYVGEDIDTSDIKNTLNDHIDNRNNPHEVTKAQVGLSEVPNLAPPDLVPGLADIGEDKGDIPQLSADNPLSVLFAKIARVIKRFTEHLTARNPHNITAEMIGVGQPVFGKYVGDAKPTRTINLGFRPKAVFIQCASKSYYTFGFAADDGNGTVIGMPGYDPYAGTDRQGGLIAIAKITDGGFTVYANSGGEGSGGLDKYKSYTNNRNIEYSYIAFR